MFSLSIFISIVLLFPYSCLTTPLYYNYYFIILLLFSILLILTYSYYLTALLHILSFTGISANDVCNCPSGSSHCPSMPTFKLYLLAVLWLDLPKLLRINYTPFIYVSLLLFKYLLMILSLLLLLRYLF